VTLESDLSPPQAATYTAARPSTYRLVHTMIQQYASKNESSASANRDWHDARVQTSLQ